MTPEAWAAEAEVPWMREARREIVALVRRAIAEEREACARYFEQPGIVGMWRAPEIAAAIRARST